MSLKLFLDKTGIKANFPPHGAWKAGTKHKIGLAKAYAIRNITQLRWRNDFHISKKAFAQRANDWTSKQWSSEWQIHTEQTCKQTAVWFPVGSKPDIAKGLFFLNRDKLGRMIQFLTGHGWLRYAQAKRGEKQSAICRLCNNGDETPWHLWTVCLGTKQIRLQCRILNNLWTIRKVDRFLGTNTMVRLLDVKEEE